MPDIDPAQIVVIKYTNHRCETSTRRILPQGIRFDSTPWHPVEQWLLTAWDLDKAADRTFAMKDILEWRAEASSE